jgi:hypothetical protein
LGSAAVERKPNSDDLGAKIHNPSHRKSLHLEKPPKNELKIVKITILQDVCWKGSLLLARERLVKYINAGLVLANKLGQGAVVTSKEIKPGFK